ncbi:MAG TPA: transglycosylase SLT domain-containing protein [Actinoplanes sp.]|nr:transglycosylase SLT domain-containing protein [Actinoplanes sp.]
MPRFSAEQIYGFARRAGFSPDEAATMTAISLAESGGNSRAHNPHGEDSRGLWQINARAHPGLAAKYDLYDPLQNAKAAYAVSHQGSDISPWTVTHGGNGARYLRYREDAQNAAVAYGDGTGRGVWTGTPGYGHPVSASKEDSASDDTNAALETFLRVARDQVGDPYIFGAEARLGDSDPDVFDCSELTQWAAHQAGGRLPDGATAQYLHLKQRGLLIPVEQAKDTPGALLFSFDREPRPGDGRTPGAHVAISLGDGRTVEAANRRAGVRESTAGDRFEYAAVIPGISDGSVTPRASTKQPAEPEPVALLSAPEPEPAAQPELGGPDTDRDGLSDALERRLGLDSMRADTDGDNLSDAQELIVHGTDGRRADTDGDGLNDAFELAQGLNPLAADTDHDGHLDGSLVTQRLDADADGIDDDLERALRLDANRSDSDADGFSDGLEYRSGSNPLDGSDTPLTHRPAPGTRAPARSELEPDPQATYYGTAQVPGSEASPGSAAGLRVGPSDELLP